MCAFVDHGEHGTGETLVTQLRPGSASPWNTQDHIEALDLALAQLPEHERAQVLVRTDSGGCAKAFLTHITKLGLEYSIGFPAQETVKTALQTIPAHAWRAATDSDGNPRDGAQIAELTAWMPAPVRATRPGPQDWPPGMRVIARRERHTPAPNYASPTTTAGGSPASPPTPTAPAGPWTPWKSATGNAPAPKTASAA
jgi:DDE family transposase